MAAGDLSLVLAQFVAFVVVGWATARVLLRAAEPEGLGVVETGAMTAAGFVCFAVGAMLLNVVSRGAVFGVSGVVPLLALVPIGAWIRLGLARRDLTALRASRSRGALLLALALVALYFLPVVAAGSGVRTGDPPWHLGWTEQLLGGEPVPVGPAADFARNAYPWGYHATLSSVVRLVPGSTPLLAHEAVHLVLLASIPLVAAALARRVDRRAGLAAATSVSLVGGFGWVLARGPAFEPSPRSGQFGADLVTASPNSVYELLPPALPRELGLVLAGAAALLLVAAIEGGTRRTRLAAGAAGGLVGLVSVPMLFTALAWGAAASALARERRVRTFVEIAAPALAVFALWAAPVAFGYLQHGGFVDITSRLGMEWPLPTALGAYGLLLPLAIAGVVTARSARTGGVMTGLLGASALLLGLAVARDVFDWSVWNNATLLHQGRMWPPVHLLAGVFAGVALVRLLPRVASRLRVAAVVTGGAVAVASPVVASLQMHEILDEGRAGYEYAGANYEEGSFVREAAAALDPDDVAVGGTDALLWALFQLSGARIAAYDDPRFERNDLRIRYSDLAQEWDERAAAEGFEPTHVVIPSRGPVRDVGEVLARGEFEDELWLLVEIP